jgi:hypothetical protein
MIILPGADITEGAVVEGAQPVIREWPATGTDQEVAPPSRYIFILPTRLDEFIQRLREGNQAEHPAVYAQYASQLLE